MKLHNNQLYLLRHLARFNLLDYQSCLELLETPEKKDPAALSYAFRPLTKNRYLAKHRDGSVAILAKGRALFPELSPLISAGGGEKEQKRIMDVSRMAARLEHCGVPAAAILPDPTAPSPCFIPSACWRKLAPGILSTTRFTGMLAGNGQRLAVYDIGDGKMEWQARAEGSLFYTRYGSVETKADGMILVCRDDVRDKAAVNIIRQTMWNRRQLLQSRCAERNRPVCWSRSPIKLKAQYRRVYLTTYGSLAGDLPRILSAEDETEARRGDAIRLPDPAQGDFERWPYRYFLFPATDLLKYVYFFSACKSLPDRAAGDMPPAQLRYALIYRPVDIPILRMYPDVVRMEGLQLYEYRPEQNT